MKHHQHMRLIIIGIQGSGKSTQGNLLAKKLNIPYLSSGHIFRAMAKEKTKWGRYVKETINAGVLMPDSKTNQIIGQYLRKKRYQKGYILDGFPRTIKQVKMFREDIDAVIYLVVSAKESLWRLSGRIDEGNREDNTLQALRKRIDSFHELTKPVINHYRKKNLLLEINGEKKIKEIHKEILSRLNKKLKKSRG